MNGSARMEEQCWSTHDVHVLSSAKKGLCLVPPPPKVHAWLMQEGEGGVSRSGRDEVLKDDCMIMLLVHGIVYTVHLTGSPLVHGPNAVLGRKLPIYFPYRLNAASRSNLAISSCPLSSATCNGVL